MINHASLRKIIKEQVKQVIRESELENLGVTPKAYEKMALLFRQLTAARDANNDEEMNRIKELMRKTVDNDPELEILGKEIWGVR